MTLLITPRGMDRCRLLNPGNGSVGPGIPPARGADNDQGRRIVSEARAEAGLILARAHDQARVTLEEVDRLARDVRTSADMVRREAATATSRTLAQAQEALTEAQLIREDVTRRAEALEQQESLRSIIERIVADWARPPDPIPEGHVAASSAHPPLPVASMAAARGAPTGARPPRPRSWRRPISPELVVAEASPARRGAVTTVSAPDVPGVSRTGRRGRRVVDWITAQRSPFRQAVLKAVGRDRPAVHANMN